MSLYAQSAKFRSYTAETRRNYATDIALLLTALWARGVRWMQASTKDLSDYEHWRRFAEENPQRISGSKWDRELAAFSSLFGWAAAERHVALNPVAGLSGRAKDGRPSNVHWLTPRTWRLWMEVGLRGHGVDGVPESGWIGRLEDRNVAFVRLLTSSGLRLQEAGALLTFEVPSRPLAGGRYVSGKVAGGLTRAKRSRTFYASVEAVGDVEAYVEASRAYAVRRAQRAGRYRQIPGLRLVTEVTRGLRPKVCWREPDGTTGRRELDLLTWQERMRLFTEGPDGLEPLWLWLNERGLPFRPHSWEGVFREANERCDRVLTPAGGVFDPHRVFAPYATPHSARHSFALFMLVVLNDVMDRRYGLTPEERRDYRLLYGDPWFMVQVLLGHASRETTLDRYLAPVRHLQLESLLFDSAEPLEDGPASDLDAVFARVARAADGIQDIDARMDRGEGAAA